MPYPADHDTRNRLSAVPMIASPLQTRGGWNSLFTPIVSRPGRTGLRPGWPQCGFERGRPGKQDVAAVINSQAIEDFRAAEPLGNDRPDRRFLRDVHVRPPFLQANSSCDSTGSSISGPRAVSFRSFRSTVRLTPRNAAAWATVTCRAEVQTGQNDRPDR